MPANFQFGDKLVENTNTQISYNERRGLIRKYHQVTSEISLLFPQELNLTSIPTPFDTKNLKLIQQALFPAHVTANPKVDLGKVILFAFSVIDVKYSTPECESMTQPIDIDKSILASQLLSAFAIRNIRNPRQLQLKREINKPFSLPELINLSKDVYSCVDIYIESVSQHKLNSLLISFIEICGLALTFGERKRRKTCSHAFS